MATEGTHKVDAEKILRCVCAIVVTVAKVAYLVWICFHG